MFIVRKLAIGRGPGALDFFSPLGPSPGMVRSGVCSTRGQGLVRRVETFTTACHITRMPGQQRGGAAPLVWHRLTEYTYDYLCIYFLQCFANRRTGDELGPTGVPQTCGNCGGFVPSINLVWHCSIAPLNSKRRAQHCSGFCMTIVGWSGVAWSDLGLAGQRDDSPRLRQQFRRGGFSMPFSHRSHRSHRWQGHWGCRKMPNPMAIMMYPLQALKYVDESFYRERDFMVEAVAIAGRWRPILLGYPQIKHG